MAPFLSFQMDHSEISELLCNSPWQFKRQNLRLQTVLGEGNFGKVMTSLEEKVYLTLK